MCFRPLSLVHVFFWDVSIYFIISKNARGVCPHARVDSDESSFVRSATPCSPSCLRHSALLEPLPHFQKGENSIKNILKYNFLRIVLLNFGVERFSVIRKLDWELLVNSCDKTTYKYICLLFGGEECQYN